MAQTTMGGMFPLNADMQLEAQGIARRRALADMLTANSLKPIDPMQNSGKYITPISPVQGLAQLGQALLASHASNKVAEEERALGQRSQDELMNTLFGKPEAVAPPPSPPISSDMPQFGGMAAADSPLGTPQLTSGLAKQPVMQRQGGILPPGVDPRAVALAIQSGQLGPLVMKAVEQGFPTPANLTHIQQGRSLPRIGALADAMDVKAATQVLPPGSYVEEPGKAPRFIPDVKSGFGAQIGQNGEVSVSALSGAPQAIADIEGAKEAAVQAAKDKYAPLVTLKMSNGVELLVTAAQARAMANGQPPVSQNPPPASAPQSGQDGRNNFGNLRSKDGKGFQSFASPEEGVAASIQNLMAYGRGGVNTIAKVISKWAPPNENNTNGYIQFVSSRMGVNANAPLNMQDPQTLSGLASAIFAMEGRKGADGRPVNPAQIQAGAQLAFGGNSVGIVTGQTDEQKTQQKIEEERRKTGAVAGSKFITDAVTKSFDAAQKAADAIPALHDIGSLLDKGVYAAKGPFSGGTVELVAKTLGADPAKVANTADLKSVTITQLLSMASQLPGTLSDKDMATLKSGQASPDSMSEQTMRQIVARAEEGLRRVGKQHERTLARFDKADLTNAFGNTNFDVAFAPPRTPVSTNPQPSVSSPLPAPPQKAANQINGWSFQVLPKGR